MIVAVVLALGFGLILFGRLRRKAASDKRGADPTRPDHVRIVEPVTGAPDAHRWFRPSSPGSPGGGKPGGPVSYAVRRLFWASCASFANHGTQLRDCIASFGVVVFVGPNGSGKSLLAVEASHAEMGKPWSCDDLDHHHNEPVREHAVACRFCVRTPGHLNFCDDARAMLATYGQGVTVCYSTVQLLQPATGEVHEHYRALTSLNQLRFIEHAVVLLDEVEEVAGADQSATMPGALKRWLKQLRKRDVLLYVTTPGYDSCAKAIRQICRLVIDCRSKFEVASATGRRWRPRLAMIFTGYDAFEFQSFDKASGKRLPALAREFYWRPSNMGQHGYNTLAQVHGLSEVDETGACNVCNGTRSRARCACAPDIAHVHPDDLVVIEVEGPKGGKARRGVRRSEVAESGGVPSGVPDPVAAVVGHRPGQDLVGVGFG